MRRSSVVLGILLGGLLATPTTAADASMDEERRSQPLRTSRADAASQAPSPRVEESIRRLRLRFIAHDDGSLSADPGTYVARFADGQLVLLVRDVDGRVREDVPFRYEFTGVFSSDGNRIATTDSTVGVRHAEDWLELDRSDLLTERYEVRESGVEQIFVLHDRPEPLEGDLEIRGALDTPLRPELAEPLTGQPILFLEGAEPVVRVGRVLVRDADGRELPGRLRAGAGLLSIILDGNWLSEARYPVEIDPLIGSTRRVNPDGEFYDPDLSYNELTGQFLIVWEASNFWSGHDIYGALIDDLGNVENPEIWIRTGGWDQRRPTVGWASSSNRWLTCWEEEDRNLLGGSEWDIACRVLEPDGEFVNRGPVISVEGNSFDQSRPDVGCGPQECILVYEEYQPVVSNYDVRGARVDTQTSSVAGKFPIANYLERDENRPAIASRPGPNGEFMVVYGTDTQMSDDVKAVVVSSTGSIVDECTLGEPFADESNPDVAFHDFLQLYLIAWERDDNTYAQLQWHHCDPFGEAILLRDEASRVMGVRVAGGSPDGCFAVASQVDRAGQPNVLLQTMCQDNSVRETATVAVEVAHEDALSVAYGTAENLYTLAWADASDDPAIGVQNYATTLCPDADGDLRAVCDGVCTHDNTNVCGDCDDSDASVYPNAPEICDGKDNDCDGSTPTDEVDMDGDGVLLCEADCDDGNADRYPGNPEVCDEIDNDCNGEIPPDETDDDGDGWSECEGDCDDTNDLVDARPPERLCRDHLDNDCDGTLDCYDTDCEGAPGCVCFDFDGDSWVVCDDGCKPQKGDKCGDCDDGNYDVNPWATEDCQNGIDDNCNERVDAEDPACSPVCPDPDGDGWVVCEGGCVPDIGVECGDCDEGDPGANPGETEDCQAAGDEDCDGLANIADPDCTICPDTDDDGWAVCAPNCALGAGDSCGDCEDGDGDIHPGALERCNELDDNCDGVVPTDEIDDDVDGMSECQGDCDDNDPMTFLWAPEECDRKDNDCDGSVPPDETDDDDDGWAECEGDCEPTEPDVYPGAAEICDGFDNDCSGSLPPSERDDDSDGYTECDGDCDDNNGSVNPGRTEEVPMCNDETDDDCDGLVDCWDDGCSDYFWCTCRDLDSDGWVDCSNGCTPESPELLCGDCNDNSAWQNPGELEDCYMSGDEDCDGLADDDDPDCWPPCSDNDNDGWADCASPCLPDTGDECGDCHDWDESIHPGIPDDTCDGEDNDCDGLHDEDVLPPAGSITLVFDDPHRISWNSVTGASGFRVVRGDTVVLRQTGGDFEQSTVECMEPDCPDTTADYPHDPSNPGECEWVLVSALNCAGLAGFDCGGPGQQGSRDAGIAASGVCP